MPGAEKYISPLSLDLGNHLLLTSLWTGIQCGQAQDSKIGLIKSAHSILWNKPGFSTSPVQLLRWTQAQISGPGWISGIELLEFRQNMVLKKLSLLMDTNKFCSDSTVIPAMVQRLFFDIIKQCDHKYATPPLPWKQFYVFLATAPTGVITAGTAGLFTKANLGKGAHLWKKRRRCTIAGITVHCFSLFHSKTNVNSMKS